MGLFTSLLKKENRGLNLNEFKYGLELLDENLTELHCSEHYEFYCIGGFVIMTLGLREESVDIDAFYKDNNILKKAIDNVGKILHNSKWLNNQLQHGSDHKDEIKESCRLIRSQIPDGMSLYKRGNNYSLYVCNGELLILLKLLASRDSAKDDNDLINLMNEFNYSVEDVLKLFKKYNVSKDSYYAMVIKLEACLLERDQWDFNMKIDHETLEVSYINK